MPKCRICRLLWQTDSGSNSRRQYFPAQQFRLLLLQNKGYWNNSMLLTKIYLQGVIANLAHAFH
jgi:hypothetical protein